MLVTSHENPDGDALGSLVASQVALEQLGKESVMVLTGTRRSRGSTVPALDGLERDAA